MDRLGVLASGLAQVGVQVDEAGEDEEAGGVEDFRVAGLDAVRDLGHDAVLQQHVGAPVALRGRVDDAPSADQQRPAHASPSQGCPPRRR